MVDCRLTLEPFNLSWMIYVKLNQASERPYWRS
jgi:hypothetical protein